MRKFLAAATGVLLITAVAAAGLQSTTAAGRTAATPARLRPTGLVPPAAPTAAPAGASLAASATFAPGRGSSSAAPATLAGATGLDSPRVFPSASPAAFNVDRPQPKIDDRLTEQLAASGPTDRLVVFVHAADAGFAASAAERTGLTVVTRFAKVGVIAAVGTPAALRSLMTVRGVSYLQAGRPIEFFQTTSHVATRGEEARKGFSVSFDEPQPDKPGSSKKVCTSKKRRGRTIKTCRFESTKPEPQPPIRRTLTSPGVDGSGVSVAIIDSGVDGTHPMFQQDGKSKVVKNLKFAGLAQCQLFSNETCTGQQGNADDAQFVPVSDGDSISLGGHGTHVAGIAAGVDVTTTDGKKLHGAAPGAKLVSLSVGGGIAVIGADAALNWVLEHHNDPCGNGSCPPIKVTNNSYGPPGGGEFNPEDVTTKLQRALAVEGVVTVWANGNGDAQNVGGDGSDNRSNPPGQDPTPGILSVANYDDGNSANRDNLLDSSSSRGEKGRPLTYPDLSAPGSEILSACRPQLAICRGTTTGDLNYGVIGGTSMAAPHVAGIVAQLFEANPALTPAQIEDALEDTARPFAFGGSYEADPTNDGITSFDKGHGLVDVVGAVARARSFPFFPAGTSPCTADGFVTVDPAGDARDLASAENTPIASEPSLDVLSGAVGWDSVARVAQFRIKVKDLGDKPLTTGSDGEAFNVFFTHYGTEYRVNASRSSTGAQTFSLTGAPATAPKVTGAFDPAGDTVTINLPVAALGSATVPTPTDGTALLNIYAWSRRVAGQASPVADRTGGQCPYTLGLGAVPPPAGTTTGPDPTPKAVAPYQPGPQEGSVAPGGTYTWKGAARTDVGAAGNADGVATEGTPCDYTIQGCDDRFIRLEVPAGGSVLTAALKATSPGTVDLDLYVLDPTGKEIARSATNAANEKVSVPVTLPGVYTIRIVHFVSVQGTYEGAVTLA